MMRGLYLVLLLSASYALAEGAKPVATAIFDPHKKDQTVQASSGNECLRREAKKDARIICYRCCVGEIEENTVICKGFSNYNNAKKKKACGCL